MKHGVKIASDSFGIQRILAMPMDVTRVEILTDLLQDGGTEQIMLSHDYVMHWLGRSLPVPEPIQQLLPNWYLIVYVMSFFIADFSPCHKPFADVFQGGHNGLFQRCNCVRPFISLRCVTIFRFGRLRRHGCVKARAPAKVAPSIRNW